MKAFHDFLLERLASGGFSTEDTLASALPLFRQAAEAHTAGQVAPLDGIGSLHVEGVSIFFEEARRRPVRQDVPTLRRIEAAGRAAVEIVAEMRRTADVDGDFESVRDLSIAEVGEAVERPVYVLGYRAWEHLVDHHDPLTDIFSLGLILASLACGLDFSRHEDLQTFVGRRKNLFALAGRVHPVLARIIVRMTELDRHRRAQDLPALIRTLEHYRDQDVDFELDLAQVPDYEQRDSRGKRTVVLTKLRERLFELSRRNRLLHFRSTMASVNLTQASVPLSFDIRNIRADQILIWSDAFGKQLQSGRVSLNKYLNFAEALYLPGQLDRIAAEARKDEAEFGFAQLRLVICFLHWANLKETPVEQNDSPLVLLPVKLIRKKGIRDTYVLEVLSAEAEVNPVVRHLFQQLYGISLPETLDLEKRTLEAFFAELEAKVQASEPGISLNKIDRPRIALIHEKARRKLDHYFRRARLAGRGVRSFEGLEYSYDPANYHPLGIKLFAERVRPPSTRLREIIEERPRPRTFVVAPAETDVVEKERSFFALTEGGDDNAYTWNFDLCNVTLANFRYRKMSLVRDYESLLENGDESQAFDCVFSLTPREATRALPEPAPLEDRYDVVPCDPTQATAIDEARCGRSYIIQGPPGTGKSQTITNLIADYVARGKRVLFVCEKRAAIDVVYARLRHCGLANLCSLIHDSQTDKKAFVMDLKETYEAFLKSANKKKRKSASRDAVLAGIRRELEFLERFDAAMRDVPPHAGAGTRELLDRCIACSSRLPKLSPLERERLPAYAEFAAHEHVVARFTDRWRRTAGDDALGRHPLRLLDPAVVRREEPLDAILSAVESALPRLARLVDELNRSRIPRGEWDSLARAAELADYAKLMRPLVRARQVRLLDAKSRQSQALRAESRRLDRVRGDLDTAREATANWRKKLPPVELAAALLQAEALETSYLPWLKPAWWRMRRIMNAAYDFADHVVRPSWSQVLRNLKKEYEEVENLRAAKQAVVDRLGIDLDFDELHEAKSAVEAAVPALPDWVRRIHAASLKADEPEAILLRFDAAGEHVEHVLGTLADVMSDFEDLALEELPSHLKSIKEQRDKLPEFLACLGELAELPRPVSSALRSLPWAADQIAAAAADNSLQQVYLADPWFRDFDCEARQRHADAIAAKYSDWLSANAAAIQQAACERFLEHVRISELSAAQLSAEEKEFKKRYSRGRRELEHEFGKTMRYKPIRDLVSRESGEVVRDLKPVWLMSPLSVSDALPLDGGAFDVVLFDEASQITLEEAVPSIFRARQVIVVGDEMQLPPTDFFSAKQRADEEGEISIEENGEAIQYDLDSNSFLNHSAKNLASTMLGWHYRSRSEALISFSNWAFYDGRLLTVPDERLPAAGLAPIRARQPFDGCQAAESLLARPVSFHRIEDGLYQSRRNAREAEYIAQLVGALLKLRQKLSLGIVAFSEAQQDEIESALSRLTQDDREFRDLYEAELEREEDGQYVGLLVKNLENIQGDERDVIILSICYGYNPDGKMLMNFGPINKSGGEKRLNVAFSRAKHHMAVVSSIQSTDITNDYNDGARCLKNYLRYAEAVSLGDMAAAERVLRSLSRWPGGDEESAHAQADIVADQLAEALTERGFIADRTVGQSHFRCDLALRRAGDVEYRLGILIDSPDYYDQSDLLERDVLRPKLLVNFGWRICPVLAKDWYADPRSVVERIVAMALNETKSRE